MPESSLFYELGYVGLFLSSFLAATVLPFSSEIILSAFIYSNYNMYTCVFVATFGNFAGGMSGYYLGRLGKWRFIEKYMRIKQSTMEAYRTKITPYASLAAFMAWLPFIGDFICVALGVFKCNIKRIAVFMFAGKLLRYIVWSYFTFYLLH